MPRVVFGPKAEKHLVDLYADIATAASANIAANYTEAIVRQCETLKTFPLRGTLRNDIRPGLRIMGFRRRVTIAFTVEETRVTILGVFYGGQNLESNFDEG